jgi:large subunit ribosomal protein L18
MEAKKTASKKTTNRVRRHNRIRAKVTGTAERPRLVIYRSLANHYAQLVDDTTGKTLAGASDLKMKGKKSERAKKVGEELAKIAKEKKITACVFDRNGFKYHGRVKAIADGAREGGLNF